MRGFLQLLQSRPTLAPSGVEPSTSPHHAAMQLLLGLPTIADADHVEPLESQNPLLSLVVFRQSFLCTAFLGCSRKASRCIL